MKQLPKLIMLTVLILFLSLYFGKYTNEYYENKSILTDEAIARFESDLKEGKEIDAKNYMIEEKDYNNKASKIGRKTSKIIEKSFTKGLKYLMKYVDSLDS